MNTDVRAQKQVSTQHRVEDASQKIRVYWVQTFEPITPDIAEEISITPPALYSTREKAEQAAQQYNELFHDPDQAQVVEIEVD